MNEIKKQLIPHYKRGFITSEMVENDIKLIRKLNMLFGKLEKSEKDIYVLEIINVIKTLNNVFKLENINMVIYQCVEIKYHDTLDYVIKKVLNS